MRNVVISLLTGGIAAAAMVIVLDKNRDLAEYQNQSHAPAVDSQHLAVTEESQRAEFQKALDKAMTQVTADVNAIKSELVEIRSQQSILRLNFDQLAQIVSSSTAGGQVGVDTDLADIQANVGEEGVSEEESFISLDDAMNAQAADPIWDDDAAALLTYSIVDAGFEHSHLQDIVCRGVMCRVEIYHSDEDAAAELFEVEQLLVPWEYKGVMDTTQNESGDLITVMYITREGHGFPGGS